jgi:hypothetical protein
VKVVWITLAAVGAILAVVFVFQNDYDKAFIAAAAGAVCWFLNYRVQMKELVVNNDREKAEEVIDSDDEE